MPPIHWASLQATLVHRFGPRVAVVDAAGPTSYAALFAHAAGLGRRQALSTIASIGLVFALLTALVGEGLAPPAERLAQKLRLTSMGASAGGQFRSGLWLKDSVRDKAGEVERLRFVNVGELMPDGTLRDVRVFEFDPQMRLSELVEARSARYAPPDAWALEDVDSTRFDEVMLAGDAPLVRTTQAHEAQRLWRSELTPSLLSVLLVQPDRMSALALYRYVRHLEENRQNAAQYEIALWKKVVYPLAVVVMMALALPFGYLQARAGGIGYKVFAGVMLGIAFHFLNGLFSHLGLLNTWPPLVSVSIPSIAAFVLALGMLAWVDRAR